MTNQQWLELGDKLADLNHRQWRSELSADYKPLLATSVVTPLILTAQEKRELAFEIRQTQRQILVEARAFHVAQFGSVPGWLVEALAETVAI